MSPVRINRAASASGRPVSSHRSRQARNFSLAVGGQQCRRRHHHRSRHILAAVNDHHLAGQNARVQAADLRDPGLRSTPLARPSAPPCPCGRPAGSSDGGERPVPGCSACRLPRRETVCLGAYGFQAAATSSRTGASKAERPGARSSCLRCSERSLSFMLPWMIAERGRDGNRISKSGKTPTDDFGPSNRGKVYAILRALGRGKKNFSQEDGWQSIGLLGCRATASGRM